MTTDARSGPLFERSGEGYAPTVRARGPWSPDTLHGSPVAALLAYCAERRLDQSGAARGGVRLARLTVDLSRPVPFDELQVEVSPRREGRRLTVFDLSVSASERVLIRASALCLRADAERGSVGSEFGSAIPGAPEDADQIRVDRAGNRWVSYPGTLEMRHVVSPGGESPPIVWIRADAPVVADGELSGTVRAAGIADFVSPFANMQPGRSGYVNADLTMYLHRQPAGEWQWVRVVSRGAADGLATAQAILGDRLGAYGGCAAASLISP